MEQVERDKYLGVLARDISRRYGIPIRETIDFVKRSRINDLLDERPDHVDHISLEVWSKEVYLEMEKQSGKSRQNNS